jgi:hypothetical protein
VRSNGNHTEVNSLNTEIRHDKPNLLNRTCDLQSSRESPRADW